MNIDVQMRSVLLALAIGVEVLFCQSVAIADVFYSVADFSGPRVGLAIEADYRQFQDGGDVVRNGMELTIRDRTLADPLVDTVTRALRSGFDGQSSADEALAYPRDRVTKSGSRSFSFVKAGDISKAQIVDRLNVGGISLFSLIVTSKSTGSTTQPPVAITCEGAKCYVMSPWSPAITRSSATTFTLALSSKLRALDKRGNRLGGLDRSSSWAAFTVAPDFALLTPPSQRQPVTLYAHLVRYAKKQRVAIGDQVGPNTQRGCEECNEVLSFAGKLGVSSQAGKAGTEDAIRAVFKETLRSPDADRFSYILTRTTHSAPSSSARVHDVNVVNSLEFAQRVAAWTHLEFIGFIDAGLARYVYVRAYKGSAEDGVQVFGVKAGNNGKWTLDAVAMSGLAVQFASYPALLDHVGAEH